MNYRHIYHAGNFADVVKHAVLSLVLDHLKLKESPFFALDTHAGIGRYDLRAPEARKTGEAAEGIGRLWTREPLPEILENYIKIVRQLNGNKKTLRHYPGSPMLIREALREGDRLVACELHPEDFATLKRTLGKDPRARAENRDGYEAVRALLPPPQRRGLVLIDPPFEVPDEFSHMLRALKEGRRRFADGIFMFWHPIKDPVPIQAFYSDIKALGIPDILAASLFLRPPEDTGLFNGTGLVVVNPPWTLEKNLEKLLPELAEILTMGSGFARIERIAGE